MLGAWRLCEAHLLPPPLLTIPLCSSPTSLVPLLFLQRVWEFAKLFWIYYLIHPQNNSLKLLVTSSTLRMRKVNGELYSGPTNPLKQDWLRILLMSSCLGHFSPSSGSIRVVPQFHPEIYLFCVAAFALRCNLKSL